MELSLNEEKPFYNIRKRYGSETAHLLREYWYHFHVDPPEDADEAIEYFVFGGKA